MGKINRAFLRVFTSDAKTALAAVASKHGVSVEYKGGSFAVDGGNAILKFEIAAPNAQGETLSREAEVFKRHAKEYGFKPEDLGTEFESGGETYQIIGLKRRSPKFPILASRVRDRKTYKFAPEQIKLPGTPQVTEGLTPKIRSSFADLAGQLSPENLSCDGECSAIETRRRRASIMRQWATLERRAGVKVSEDEAWRFDA